MTTTFTEHSYGGLHKELHPKCWTQSQQLKLIQNMVKLPYLMTINK